MYQDPFCWIWRCTQQHLQKQRLSPSAQGYLVTTAGRAQLALHAAILISTPAGSARRVSTRWLTRRRQQDNQPGHTHDADTPCAYTMRCSSRLSGRFVLCRILQHPLAVCVQHHECLHLSKQHTNACYVPRARHMLHVPRGC